MWPSGVQPGLSPEDEEVKQKLVKCAPRAYSELIRSDIPEPSGARLARLPFLRPSPISVMKPSLPPVSKSSEGCPPARGKTLKVGASSSPSSAVEAGDSSGRAAELPLEVLPLSVWSPTLQGAEPPSAMPDKVGKDLFGAVGSEDSLLSHAELAVGAVSSILRDSDLRKVDALRVEEDMVLLLQGTASILPRTFADHFLYCFSFVN